MSICLNSQVHIQINSCINNQGKQIVPAINKFPFIQHEKHICSENSEGIVVIEASFSGDVYLFCQMLVKDKLLIIMYDV